MTTAPSTWTFVFVPSPTSGNPHPVPLLDRVATRAGLALLTWAERRRDCIRRSVSLERIVRPSAAQRPFC